MFIMMISMLMVHVTVVQIVGVTFVLNRGMAAIGTMSMVTVVAVVVNFVIVSHGLFLLSRRLTIHEANEHQPGNEQIFHSCLCPGTVTSLGGLPSTDTNRETVRCLRQRGQSGSFS